MKWMPLVTVLVVLVFGTAAQAGMPSPQKMKCSVGGESFTHIGTASYTIYGNRPDGKPFGSWKFPIALPVCPGNGLVMYREFTGDEIARLKPLIESAEYRAMIRRDTPYFRAVWLERALKPDSGRILWMALSASWEADGDPALKKTYQQTFADLAASAKPAPEDLQWLFMQMRAANARRELGEFDAALALVRAIPRDELAVVVPAPAGDNYRAVRDAENRLWLKEYLPRLEVAIIRHDASSEPLDLLSVEIAARRCLAGKKSTIPLQPAGVCTSEKVAAVLARMGPGDELEGDE